MTDTPSPAERLHLAERAADDLLWSAYRKAEVVIRPDSGPPVRVRPTPTPGPVAAPFGPLHVVTACNPASSDDRSSDTERMLDLRRHTAGLISFPAVGLDPTWNHHEESVAVLGLTDEQARELGLRYRQVAVFAWHGPHWSVLACASDRRTDLGWHLAAE